jgi:hypothetical protein
MIGARAATQESWLVALSSARLALRFRRVRSRLQRVGTMPGCAARQASILARNSSDSASSSRFGCVGGSVRMLRIVQGLEMEEHQATTAGKNI